MASSLKSFFSTKRKKELKQQNKKDNYWLF